MLILNTILLGNTIALTLFSELTGEILEEFSWYYRLSAHVISIITVLLSTLIVVVFGESIPKNFGLAFSRFTAKIFFPLVNITKWILYPVVLPVSHFIEKILGSLHNPESKKKLTEKEIRSIIQLSYEREVVNPREKKLVDAVINLYTKQLRFYMVPRRDLIVINTSDTLEMALGEIQKIGISKILVIVGNNIDNVLGYIAIDELIKVPIDKLKKQIGEHPNIIKPIMMIPKTKRLIDALNILKAKNQSMALVTDEYGGTDGVITVNALLRELFLFNTGASVINNPAKIEQNTIILQQKDSVTVNANRSNIRLIREFFGIEKPFTEDEESVGSVILQILDRFPYLGEKVEYNNLILTVSEMKGNGITLVNIERKEEKKND